MRVPPNFDLGLEFAFKRRVIVIAHPIDRDRVRPRPEKDLSVGLTREVPSDFVRRHQFDRMELVGLTREAAGSATDRNLAA